MSVRHSGREGRPRAVARHHPAGPEETVREVLGRIEEARVD
ncbi:hypothetical protein [Saccharothrix saharensis]|nr:hypothetical protein [Saccharothrix saharensis]